MGIFLLYGWLTCTAMSSHLRENIWKIKELFITRYSIFSFANVLSYNNYISNLFFFILFCIFHCFLFIENQYPSLTRNCADTRNWPRWSITDTAGTLKETGTRPDFSNRIIERMGYGDQWSADRSIIHQAQYTYTRLIT